jgi:streptomycin 3"-adenylyltransferase
LVFSSRKRAGVCKTHDLRDIRYPSGLDLTRAAADADTMSPIGQPPVVDDIVASLRGELADELAGIYLYGSMVVGGFEDDVSDVDLIAVTTVDASQLDLTKLGRMHDELVQIHSAWEDRIEIVYVGAATLRRYREGGPVAVISPGESLHLVDGADLWLQNWYLARLTSAALVGPARETMFPAISLDEFVAAVARYATEVKDRSLDSMGPGSRAYTVLTMCRAVRTVSTRNPCSKQEGATWTGRRYPEWRALIDGALTCRASGGRRGFDDPQTTFDAALFVRQIADEIAEIAASNDQIQGRSRAT